MDKNTTTPAPNIGLMFKDHIRQNRLRRAAISRHLGKSYSTVYAYQRSKTMQTHIVWALCYTLKHNFFMDLATQLPPTFTTNAPDQNLPFQERIAALEEENKLLHAKVETLMAVVRKG